MPHEQPRPMERAPEQQRPPQERAPGRPPERVSEQPRQEHTPVPEHEHVQAPPRQEHPPAQEHVPEQGPHDPDAPRQEHPPERAPREEHAQEHPPHDGLDERHLTDPAYRTADPAGLHRIQETFIDSGFGREHPDEFRHEEVQRHALAKRDASHPGMSDAGAIAVHGYTRHEMFTELNKAMRFGGPELADLTPQARALTSGLNELPPHVGTVSRRIRFDGDPGRVEAFMARYTEGAHVVEPTFMSSSKVDATLPRSKFAGEVEMRIESKTGRDIENLASVRSEREVLFKGGTQLQVTHVEKGPGHPDNDPHGTHSREPQWIVHAEEIAPGDPRHLGAEETKQAIDERREQERAIDAAHSRSNRIWEMLGQEGPPPEPAHPVVEQSGPATHEPPGGWSELAKPLTPGGEPVLHAGSVESPQQHARLLRDLGVEQVNTRNYYAPDALERGYRTNAAESMVAFERRMNGEDVVAAPDRDGIGHRQSLDHVGEQLGKSWTARENFDGVARELGERPVGARAAVAYEEHVPAKGDAPARVETRMVAAIKTEDGVVFADPRTGRLADLPEHAQQIQSMPLGGGDAPHHVAEAPPTEQSIPDRLLGERPVHDEGYLFDPEHRATPDDHRSIGRTVADEEVFARIKEDALAKRDASPTLGHLSDEGAVAIHTYTYEHAYSLNEANRAGPGHPGFELAQQNTRAIVDGLQQIRPESGELLRGIDTKGNHRVADLVADGYVKGQVAVETTLTSATIKTEGATNHHGDDVVLHIKSDNIRDISSISQNRGEGESISPPATQLLVHDKRLEIGPTGKRTWVIEAEEIGPGHPRYLDRETAERQMAESRARHVENAPEIARLKQQAAMSRLDGLVETPPHADLPTEAPPHTEPSPESVHDVPDTTPEPSPVPEHGWSELSRATNPPSEPAIHADTASPEQRAAYVRERHPHLAEVNPHFHDPDALELGYRSNCVNGPEAYVDRVRGGDMTAEPVRVADMESRGTLEHIEGRFGQKFADRADYDAVIREMREMPVDHHAVVAVKYLDANGVEVGHVAMVVHTRDGVAFIDPQSGDLMHLPQPPKGIRLMHVGVPDAIHPGHVEHVQGSTEHGGYGAYEPVDRPITTEGREAAERFLSSEQMREGLAEHGDEHVKAKDELGKETDLSPLRDYLAAELPKHPELVRMLEDPKNDYVAHSLAKRPLALGNLLAHEESVKIFTDSVEDVAHQREHGEYESIPDEPDHVELGEEQIRTSDEARENNQDYEPADKRQHPYRREDIGNTAVFNEYLDRVYREAETAMEKLREVVPRIAEETGGEPDLRKTLKGRDRAEDKINSNYGGDPSRLTDIAGGIVRFKTLESLYAALDQVRAAERDGVEIVEFEDRFRSPQPAGYSDLQMKVRIGGHVAEFRLHLKAVDEVSAYDHSLYEVRRDLKALAMDEGTIDPETGKKVRRRYTPEEDALITALLKREREKFWEALHKRYDE